ncbi:MAG: Uma2 family endonuclease [Verrucomicrobia bacterium]|nr:Uma2 family endonuclease [Verrucomicrobiota bacterium]
MSEPYEEIVAGETILRFPPGPRHEQICGRLHEWMTASLANVPTTRLLAPRSVVELVAGTLIRPDLALVTVQTGKMWLAAEIISSEDHRTDTVAKKTMYEEVNVPRLWMIDPRYDNVEVYHGSEYGLRLVHIFAGREVLSEKLIPEFQCTIAELFGV